MNGKPISSFQDTVNKKLSEDDLFLVTVPTDDNHVFYDNTKISYGDFITQIIEQLTGMYGLGTMAWEESSNYSTIDHNHDDIYDNTTVSDLIGENTGENNAKVEVAVFIDTSASYKYDLYTPYVNVPPVLAKDSSGNSGLTSVYVLSGVSQKADPPYIGEIKMVAETTKREIDINNPEFDGWVYADGEDYEKSEFPDAEGYLYPEQTTIRAGMATEDDGKFSVPILSDFIKISREDSKQHIPGTEVLKRHKHSASLKFNSGSVERKINVKQSEDQLGGQGENGIFRGSPGSIKYECELQMEINSIGLGVDDVTENSPSEEDKNTHPSYNSIPAMIYIGKRVTNNGD